MKHDLIVDGEAMAEIEGHIDVTHLVGCNSEDAAFAAWRDSLPATHWAKYDLSACRLGWDAGRAAPRRACFETTFANCRVIDMQQDPQRAAFQAYRVAFNANASDPNLKNAAALVVAWNAFADIMGVSRV